MKKMSFNIQELWEVIMLRETCTENGIVRGLPASDPRITSFKGIPFAAPPIGENRWRAPQPAANWDGVLKAYEFAPISVQDTPGIGDVIYNREWHVDPSIPMNEDCLYLNIWTNAKSKEERKPVVVWFFGGAFQWGYTAEMELDGERLARHDIVVVSVNYRLNTFGFLAHPELTRQQPDAPTNFGSLDQQAGIKWVIRNIAAFGGDPENITIAGQSAGGGSVLSQMTCPQNEGLFKRAIIHSAMIRSPYPDPNATIGIPHKLDAAEQLGVRFFDILGVKTLAEARKLDAFYIRDKYSEYMQSNPMMYIVEDQLFCVNDPIKLLLSGQCSDMNLLIGNTTDEFPGVIAADSKNEFIKHAGEIFGSDVNEYLSFEETNQKLGENGYAPVNRIELTTKYVLSQSLKNGRTSNAYYYCFDSDIPGADHPGTFHSVDLWFFFETLAKCIRPFTGKHYDLSRKMCNYWTNFVKTGDPNGSDADGTPMPLWKPYTADAPFTMLFKSPDPIPVAKPESAYAKFLMKKIAKDLE